MAGSGAAVVRGCGVGSGTGVNQQKGIFMTAISTPKLADSTDSLLRFALRADATASGLMGIAGIPLAGWLSDVSGTSIAFEYTLSAFFIVFAAGVLAFAARPSVKRTGIVVAAGNVLYAVASVVFVLADVFPLTT